MAWKGFDCMEMGCDSIVMGFDGFEMGPAHDVMTLAHIEMGFVHVEMTLAHAVMRLAYTEMALAHTEMMLAHTEMTSAHAIMMLAHTEMRLAPAELRLARVVMKLGERTMVKKGSGSDAEAYMKRLQLVLIIVWPGSLIFIKQKRSCAFRAASSFINFTIKKVSNEKKSTDSIIPGSNSIKYLCNHQ